MKTIVLYGSNYGTTRLVVSKLKNYLDFEFEAFDVKAMPDYNIVHSYDLLLFFVPTYGDEELQEDIEDFAVNFNGDLSGKHYAICELGNYYGYDDFSFGALRILRDKMQQLNAQQFVVPLSMDTLPKKDWLILEKWCALLNKEHNRYG